MQLPERILMPRPLISLITVTYNAGKVLEATLQSAIRQTYAEIELVIVDGGSTDNTLAIAKRYESHIGSLISERDQGIYDAMNKGIRAAKGEWVYFLNAGDQFHDDLVLERIFSRNDLHDTDLIYAKVQTINEPTGVNYLNGKPVALKDFYFSYPICHQATFTRRSAFDAVGLYDIRFRLAADTEWFMRIFSAANPRALFINDVVAFYDVQGATYHKRMKGFREFLRFIPSYLPSHIVVLNYLYYPLLWLKVKLIRMLTGTAIFMYYRKRKFNNA